MKPRLSLLLSLVCFAISQGIFLKSSTAQVTSDRTTNTIVEIDGNNFTIQQGDRAGNNLFHSFSDFSVPTDGSAFFNNAADIVNIFSRVTGGNISNIDGLLSANGTANLFLINPAGIIFGEGARLDIGGSFLGSTADSIIFPEGEFSATNLANPPLISINAPIGLSFRNNPAEIVNRANLIEEERFGEEQIPVIFPNFDTNIPFEEKIVNTLVGLEVNRQQNITLVGGNIILDGGGLTALGGKIQLGGLAQAGIIAIDANGNLVFPNNIGLSNISLINDAAIDVQGNGGGDIIITGQNIEVRDGSTIFAGIRPFEGSIDAIAGDIIIKGIDSVIVDGVRGENTQRGGSNSPTNISNQIGELLEKEELNTESEFIFLGQFDFVANGEGQAGNVEINTKKLDIANGARITNVTFGQGDTGNIIINADEQVSINNISNINGSLSAIFNTVFIGKGDTGNIEINTQSLNLTDGSEISGNIFRGEGNLGNVIINGETDIFISNNGSIFSTINADGVGNGGTIEINTKSFSLNNSGQLFTSTAGLGNAGDVIINAQEDSNINGGQISSGAGLSGEGNGGTIEINTKSFSLNNSGQLFTSTAGLGNAGDVIINAQEDSNINDGQISSGAGLSGEGNGGTIEINTKSFSLNNSGQLFTSTNGLGNAGNVVINAQEKSNINGGQIRSGVGLRGEGNGGTIEINTSNLIITNRGILTVSSRGEGNVGTITIHANSLEIGDRSQILAETNFIDPNPEIAVSSSTNPNIFLNIIDGNLILRDNSLISARATEQANGGNVQIIANFMLFFPQNNDMIASAQQGQGGNINITAEALFGIAERPLNNRTNDINASSDVGLDGNISIFTPDINTLQTNNEISNNLIEPEKTVAQACQKDLVFQKINGLIIKGKGGIPAKPIDLLDSENILVDEQIITPNLQTQYPEIKPITTSRGDIYPARGIIKTDEDEIVLTAYSTDNLNSRTPHISSDCSFN